MRILESQIIAELKSEKNSAEFFVQSVYFKGEAAVTAKEGLTRAIRPYARSTGPCRQSLLKIFGFDHL